MNCELSDVNFSGGGKGRGFIDDVEKKSLNVVIDWYSKMYGVMDVVVFRI